MLILRVEAVRREIGMFGGWGYWLALMWDFFCGFVIVIIFGGLY